MINISSAGKKSYCKRCGACCLEGGPVLHEQDKEILLEGHIGRELLVTIRKGEWAFNPLTGNPEPVQNEFIKIAGKGKSWICCLYNEEKSSCSIYDRRLLECRLLKCWNTAELQAVIGKNTLTRSDIISARDPVLKYIDLLERESSLEAVEELISSMQQKNASESILSRLTDLSRRDLALRARAISEFGLSLKEELFLFGRPLFKILGSRGVRIRMAGYKNRGEFPSVHK